MNVLFLTRYGKLGASSRMRSLQFIPWFERAGMVCTVSPFIDDSQLRYNYRHGKYGFLNMLKIYWNRISALVKARDYDLVWIEKEALPWFPTWIEVWFLAEVPYVLDYDDAIFHKYDQCSSSILRYFFGHRLDRLMADSRLVTAGNMYLAQRAEDAGARWIEFIPTVVDLERYHMKRDTISTEEPLRIVWIGSYSTVRYLKLLHQSLKELSEKHDFTFRIIAGQSVKISGVQVEFVEWTHNTEVASIQACDIGVMPLEESVWELGKCGYKLIQYMACGLPVVASSVGTNCQIVNEGENGYLVKTHDDWVCALGKLMTDASLRNKMGEKGRKFVESEYSIQKIAPRLIHFLKRAALSEIN